MRGGEGRGGEGRGGDGRGNGGKGEYITSLLVMKTYRWCRWLPVLQGNKFS